MDRTEAKQLVKDEFKASLQQDRSRKGYICPICGSGSGNKGTGITENRNSRGHYTCWAGCFTNADAFEILALQDGLEVGSKEAMVSAYNRYGIEIDAPTDYKPRNEVKKVQVEQEVQEVHNYTDYYRKCVAKLSDARAMAYLSYRGISLDTAQSLWIGFDDEWQSPKAVREGKNPPKSCRLIIPTTATSYVAREADKEATGQYVKMKEGESNIFNLKAIYNDEEAPVFVTEGELDAVSIIEVGSKAIALGSASNVKKLISTLTEKPTKSTLIVCLDNDIAGAKATTELVKGLESLNISYVKADICNGCKDPNEALTKDRKLFLQAVDEAEATTANKPHNVADYIDRLIVGEIEKYKQGANRSTGFANLDKVAGGIYPGLYAIGAISSLGKTTFIHQIADQMAEAGEHILLFSLEQSRLEMVSKSIARKSAKKDIKKAITSLSFRGGNLTEDVLNIVDEYKEAVGDRISIIEGNFNCNVGYIVNYVHRYIEKNEVKPIVIIDYLQILQGDDKRQSAKDLIDSNVTELKRLSRNEDIPVFVISSVNRSNYLTPIDFESFKESGGIEYTADVVWGLQLQAINEDIFNKGDKLKEKRDRIRTAKAETPRKIELVCLKNRYGISSYKASFEYYPQYDLYRDATAFNQVAEPTPFD